MTPFKTVSRPISVDFFNIFENLGIKYIHIFGYSYESSNYEYATESNPSGTYWANMECCWFIFPLSEFVANLKENEDYVDDTYCELKQYQGDYTPEEMTDIINHYFEGHGPDAYLDFTEVTEDTPCGDYITTPNHNEPIEL